MVRRKNSAAIAWAPRLIVDIKRYAAIILEEVAEIVGERMKF
jgi:hypothetical protein